MFQDDYADTMASAEMAHYGQKRRSGEDYITHPKEVSAIVDKLYPGDDLASLVALLHDTLEDAPSLGTVKDTDEMKSFIRGSIGDSVEAEEVIEAVERLTHEPGGDYSSYVQGLLDNKLALRVKLADMLHNLSSSPSPKQVVKYGGAIRDLWKASGKQKPKGISPLHWKLLFKVANISNPSSLVTESTTSPMNNLEKEIFRVVKMWIQQELEFTLSELVDDLSEHGDVSVEDIEPFDLLNLPETEDFFRRNVTDQEALAYYEDEAFDKPFYDKLEVMVQQAMNSVFVPKSSRNPRSTRGFY
jgi:(p)ppGpp synthase/HD superfamily hydrolase